MVFIPIDYPLDNIRTTPILGDSFAAVLITIRATPFLIGRQTIHHLHSFLTGYAYCRHSAGHSDGNDWMDRFSDWVCMHFEMTLAQGWAKTIDYHAPSDLAAIDLFWSLVDRQLSCAKLPTE